MKIRKKNNTQRHCKDCGVRVPDNKDDVWFYGSDWRSDLCNNCDELRIFIHKMRMSARAWEEAWFRKFFEMFPLPQKGAPTLRPMQPFEMNQRPREFIVGGLAGTLDNILSPSPNRHMLNKGLAQARREAGGELSGRDVDKP